MNVTIDERLFKSAACFNSLDDLLKVFDSGQHEWLLTDVDVILESDWLVSEGNGRSGKRKRESLEKFSTSVVWSKNVVDRHVNSSGTGYREIPLSDAATILSLPLLLIVENGRSDRMFVEMLIVSFQHNRLEASFRRGFWNFEHAGGRNDVVNRIRDQREYRRLRGWRDDQCPRLIALIDSDSRYPGDSNSDCCRVVERCKQEDVPIHVLSKRTALNYLTAGSLTEIDAALVEAYFRLTITLRTHFNVKLGFKGDAVRGNKMIDEQEKLFDTVSSDDRHTLFRGLGDQAESFQKHSAFPKDVLHADASDPNEFQALLNFIEAHL